ncbi:cytochrome c [uncultured Chloroflexus sp.]|uniref:c-type cytochrome n=1 Tax=uncultured Chloroflexus sp. TaxID=214040 RepID=UPI002636EBCD|nr:cytochrome c [uncultured Chloroflexus sp.]
MNRAIAWMFTLLLITFLVACGRSQNTAQSVTTQSAHAMQLNNAPSSAAQATEASQASAAQATEASQASAAQATEASQANAAQSANVSQLAELLPPSLIATPISSLGDPVRGKNLFIPCSGCHSTSTEVLLGPGLAGLFSAQGPVLPEGVDYNGLLPNGKERSEENVAEWIRSGGAGSIGYMPPHNLDDQQMADLLAFLRTLK